VRQAQKRSLLYRNHINLFISEQLHHSAVNNSTSWYFKTLLKKQLISLIL